MYISREDTLIFKGIAILLVLICHIVGVFGIRYATPLGGIGVSIFLLLSGYGLNESYKLKGLKGFIRKRVSTVYLPYMLVVIIDNLILSFNLNGLLNDLLLITTPNFMWFIQFIVINYFLFYLINLIVPEKAQNFAWIIIGILLFFFGSALIAEQSFIFWLGIYLSNKSNDNKPDNNNQIILSILLLVIGACALLIKQLSVVRLGSKYIYYLIETILKNCSALGIITLLKKTPINMMNFKFIFSYLGKYAYEIYLIHAIAFFVLKNNINLIGIFEFLIITMIGAILLKFIKNQIFNFKKGENSYE